MNATKRKFNALLQGIGTRSTGSVSTSDRNDPSRPSSLDADRGANSEGTPASISSATTSAGGGTAVAAAAGSIRNPSDMPFTTTTTTPTSSAVASLEFLAKRRRVGLSGNNATANGSSTLRDATGNAATTPSNIVLRKWGSTGRGGEAQKQGQTQATQTPPSPAPRYCPGDREQLLRRLATFQELTDWTPKPDRINEIEWAKRGWVCQGKERLRCTLCSKELIVRLSRQGDGDKEVPAAVVPLLPLPGGAAEAALVDKYADLIVSAHQDDCLWQRKGCDDSLLRLPLASPRQALADLRQRYDELCARKDFLPYEFNLRLPDGLDVDAVLATLPPTFFDAPSSDAPASSSSSPPNRAALALAVMGWQGLMNSRIGAVPNSASCHACLRRLGLWMFKSKQVDLETNTVLEPAPMDHLDAVREHRFFCPWKNGTVQRNPGARTGRSHQSSKNNGSKDDTETPGWDVLVHMLRNDAYLRNRVAAPANRRPLTAGGGAGATSVISTPSKAGANADTASGVPSTPVRRPATAVDTDVSIAGTPDGEAEEEDEAARNAKDKERWARLRRVKSLFDTKGTMAKKLKRAGVGGSSSRPGTGHSSLRPDSQGQS